MLEGPDLEQNLDSSAGRCWLVPWWFDLAARVESRGRVIVAMSQQHRCSCSEDWTFRRYRDGR